MPSRSSSRTAIRYAIVGLGHIAQVAVLPAFAHAQRNSRVTALVSSDAKKLNELSAKYSIESTFSYDDYAKCLQEVDAVYIALPNFMHAEYTIRAAEAGVHVLCEKPMAVTVEECERMIDACGNRVKLMVAYRLHFEAINLKAIDLVRQGRIGVPKFFNSSFSMRVRPGNIRTHKISEGGGTLYDIGIYCINAARYLFRGEPKEVVAVSVNSGEPHLKDIDESTAAILRFEDERVASFVTSFNASDVGFYQIVGTEGDLRVDPAYEYAEGLGYELTVDGRTDRKRIGPRDQFAAELLYFSDCIKKNRAPEPPADEGLQDVRIIRALYESAETGKPVEILPFKSGKQRDPHQRITRPAVGEPELANAESGSQD